MGVAFILLLTAPTLSLGTIGFPEGLVSGSAFLFPFFAPFLSSCTMCLELLVATVTTGLCDAPAHAHARVHAFTHTYFAHADNHAHEHTDTHTHTHAQTHTHTPAHARTHARTRVRGSVWSSRFNIRVYLYAVLLASQISRLHDLSAFPSFHRILPCRYIHARVVVVSVLRKQKHKKRVCSRLRACAHRVRSACERLLWALTCR